MSGELLQVLAIGAVVLGAVAYMARRGWKTLAAARTPKDQGGCGGGCGCG